MSPAISNTKLTLWSLVRKRASPVPQISSGVDLDDHVVWPDRGLTHSITPSVSRQPLSDPVPGVSHPGCSAHLIPSMGELPRFPHLHILGASGASCQFTPPITNTVQVSSVPATVSDEDL